MDAALSDCVCSYIMAPQEFGELSCLMHGTIFRGGTWRGCLSMDLSRLLWLARPEYLQDEDLKQRIIASAGLPSVGYFR